MLDTVYGEFAPAPELKEWAEETFVHVGGPLENEDHAHLMDAQILFLWYSKTFMKRGQVVVATAQLGYQQGSLGKKELLEQRFREWHGGEIPDFVITISAPYLQECSPVGACAVVEHELYHCGQARDMYGEPKFTERGLPVWCMRGHDVEEFVGVAARYGAHSPELMALKTVLNRDPLVGQADVVAACGCGARIG